MCSIYDLLGEDFLSCSMCLETVHAKGNLIIKHLLTLKALIISKFMYTCYLS